MRAKPAQSKLRLLAPKMIPSFGQERLLRSDALRKMVSPQLGMSKLFTITQSLKVWLIIVLLIMVQFVTLEPKMVELSMVEMLMSEKMMSELTLLELISVPLVKVVFVLTELIDVVLMSTLFTLVLKKMVELLVLV